MRTIDLDTMSRHPSPDCFAFSSGAFLWTDETTPRTDKPVRFCYLSNTPEVRPCLARGYMQYVRPVRFA